MVLETAGARTSDAAAKTSPKKVNSYPCGVLATPASYRGHQNLHGGRKYKCSLCPKTYPTTGSLNRHSKRIHGRYPCHICRKVLQTERGFENHMKVHSNKTKYKCPLCHKVFFTIRSLWGHGKAHTARKDDVQESHKMNTSTQSAPVRKPLKSGKKPTHHSSGTEYKCPLCHKTFFNIRSLWGHGKAHTAQKDDVTKVQESHKMNASTQSAHVREPLKSGKKPTHHKRLTCQKCGRILCNRTSYDAHMNLHVGRRPFKCSLCPKDYSSRHGLRRHLKLCHDILKSDPKSGLPRSASTSVEGHADPGSRETEMIISIPVRVCVSVSADAKKSLHNGHDKDMGESSGVTSEGSIHNKLESSASSATVHADRHTSHVDSDKPFKCSHCDKAYSIKRSLRRHRQLKHGYMKMTPASEPTGTPSESHSSRLKALNGKVSEASYQCGSCSQPLGSLDAYKAHLHQHSSKTQVRCVLCSKVYRNACKLWLHQRKVHTLKSQQLKPPSQTTARSSQRHSFACGVCIRVFNSQSERDVHMMTSHGPCSKCGRLLSTKLRFKAHMNKHAGRRPFKCQMCSKHYCSAQSLQQHLCARSRVVSRGKRKHFAVSKASKAVSVSTPPSQCNMTPKAAEMISIQPLIVPRDNASGHGYKCVLCGRVLCRRDAFCAHMNLHTGARPYTCQHCGASFSRSSQRRNHVKHEHSSTTNSQRPPASRQPQTAKKQVTQSSFTSSKDSQHTPISENGMPPSGKGTPEGDGPTTAATHTLEHQSSKTMKELKYRESTLTPVRESLDTSPADQCNSERSFSCGVCGATMQRYTSYMAHMTQHTSRHTHKCNQCFMPFPSVTTLWNHKKLKHSCQAGGHESVKCAAHSRGTELSSEAERKEYTCTHCGSTYLQASSLNKHMYVKHPLPRPPISMKLRGAESNRAAATVVDKQCSEPPESVRVSQGGNTVEMNCMFDVVDMGLQLECGTQCNEVSDVLTQPVSVEGYGVGGCGTSGWEVLPVCGGVLVDGGEGVDNQRSTDSQSDTVLMKYGSWNVYFFGDTPENTVS